MSDLPTRRYATDRCTDKIPIRQLGPACPRGISDDDVVPSRMLSSNKRSQAAEFVPYFCIFILDPMKHPPTEIVEPQLVHRSRIWVELDRHQIQTQGCESESGFVDVETYQLIVEDPPEDVGVRSLSIGSPMLGYQFAECRQEKDSAPDGWIENLGRLADSLTFQSAKRTLEPSARRLVSA